MSAQLIRSVPLIGGPLNRCFNAVIIHSNWSERDRL